MQPRTLAAGIWRARQPGQSGSWPRDPRRAASKTLPRDGACLKIICRSVGVAHDEVSVLVETTDLWLDMMVLARCESLSSQTLRQWVHLQTSPQKVTMGGGICSTPREQMHVGRNPRSIRVPGLKKSHSISYSQLRTPGRCISYGSQASLGRHGSSRR